MVCVVVFWFVSNNNKGMTFHVRNPDSIFSFMLCTERVSGHSTWRKTQSCVYSLRILRSFIFCSSVLRMIYESVVALLYAVACWDATWWWWCWGWAGVSSDGVSLGELTSQSEENLQCPTHTGQPDIATGHHFCLGPPFHVTMPRVVCVSVVCAALSHRW